MDNLKTNKTIALVFGLALLIFFIYNRINPIIVSSGDDIIVFFIFHFIIRILSGILCFNIAKDLNRDQLSWGMLGLLSPPISLIIMFFMSEKQSLRK